MKFLLLLTAMVMCNHSLFAQLKPVQKTAVTTTLPAGTKAEDGNIVVQTGYRAVVSPVDSKVVLIQKTTNLKMDNNATTGSFACVCEAEGADDCTVSIRSGNVVFCSGVICKNCVMNVTINPTAGANITRATKNQVWKKYLFTKKTN
jgi:hypothetical protein